MYTRIHSASEFPGLRRSVKSPKVCSYIRGQMSPIVWGTGDRQMTSCPLGCPCREVPQALTEPMECTGTHSSSMAIHTHYPLFRFGNPCRATYSSGVALEMEQICMDAQSQTHCYLLFRCSKG